MIFLHLVRSFILDLHYTTMAVNYLLSGTTALVMSFLSLGTLETT